MTTKTYVRVNTTAHKVAEPPITLDAAVNISSIFPGMTFVDVTALGTTPQEGWTATLSGGSWSFTAPSGGGSPAVPGHVSSYKFKSQLATLSGTGGLTVLDNVNAWMGSQSTALQLKWNQAKVLFRNGAVVTAAAANFSWASGDIDSWFIAAQSISDLA